MPQAREIKRRIRSVENTKQITRAMKMVAAAKLHRAQARMLAMRPYAQHLAGTIERVSLELFGDEHPLFEARPEQCIATVVLAGDRGLCGGFNANIIRRARRHFADHPDVEHRVWCIGRRATSALSKVQNVRIVRNYEGVFDSLSYVLANEICDELTQGALHGEIDSAWIVYNEFVTVVTQKPTVRRVVPVDFDEILAARREREAGEREQGKGALQRLLYELEPSPEAVLRHLVTRLVATHVYRATLESYAAELGARMSAMDSATKNAEDMVQRLTMDFNRARQTGITAELLDIVGGAEGLKA